MNRMLTFLCISCFLACSGYIGLSDGFAQGTAQGISLKDDVTMADTMRSNGKIYVVLVVVLIIQAGIFLMLWNLDRKISKLEKS